MMSYQEAIDVINWIIADKGRGFDWKSYKRFASGVSEDAKHLAISVLDQNKQLAEDLRKAIGIELNCDVHRDYVYRVLALALDDDDMGNHLSVNTLAVAKWYRTKRLGMAY